jgi:hypothetical protein
MGTAIPLRLVAQGADMSAPAGPRQYTVHRSADSVLSAMQQAALMTSPGAADAMTKTLETVDFTREMAVLIDLGYAGGIGGNVTPVAAIASPDRVLVRFTVPTPEATLPAVNHPYGILAISRTDKPVTIEAVSDAEMLGTALKGLPERPIPRPTAIPSARTYAVTGSRITVPGSWVVWKQEAPADWQGNTVRLDIASPTESRETGASLTIETLPLLPPQLNPSAPAGQPATAAAIRQAQKQPISWPPLSWRTGVFDEPWLGSIVSRLANGHLNTTMARYRFPAGVTTYDRLTLAYRDGALSEAEALTILDSWQPTP